MPCDETVQALTVTRGKSLEEIARQNMTVLFGPKFQKEQPGDIEAMVERYMENPPPRKPFTQQFFAVLRHDCYDRLPGIDKPTLIVTGDADVLIPPENSEALRSRIPGSRLVQLPDAGHVFFIEDPEETARVLKEYLLGNGSG
jgi:pimeloyl-ACP methyl ester carboxylesterase